MAYLWRHPKSKYWYAAWKDVHGKRMNRSTRIIAKLTKQSRKDAQRIADEYESATQKTKSAKQIRQTLADLQKDILGDDLPTATIAEYSKRFFDFKKGETAEMGLQKYRLSINRFLEWLGERAHHDIGRFVSADIVRYRNELLRTFAPSTVANKIKAIKAMFRMAHEEGMCPENPAATVKLSKKSNSTIERRAFTLDELGSLLQTASGEWRSMLLFGLYTGQRLGDLAMLKWSAINLESMEIRFLTQKTKHPILQPIAEPLKEHILSLGCTDDPAAFLHPELALRYERHGSGSLSNQFSNILAEIGLRKKVSHQKKPEDRAGRRETSQISFHSLRATAVTLMHEAGVPASMVEQWVGHNSKEVNRQYVKHGREALAQATSKLPHIL
jgi:integrase